MLAPELRAASYDAGALIAAERGDRRFWALHLRVVQAGAHIVVPAVVLARVWRGGPQAALSRALCACSQEPTSVADARAAGVACARAGTRDVVDALVVVGALRRGDIVYTSDPEDLVRLARSVVSSSSSVSDDGSSFGSRVA